jgi:hypothetical protein
MEEAKQTKLRCLYADLFTSNPDYNGSTRFKRVKMALEANKDFQLVDEVVRSRIFEQFIEELRTKEKVL